MIKPQNKIFLKIFLWFWLATILMIETMGALTQATEPRSFHREMRSIFGSALSAYGQVALDTLDRQGVSSLQEYIANLKQTANVDLYLYDTAGRELAGRRGPGGIERAVESAAMAGRDDLIVSPGGYVAYRLLGKDGQNYFVAGSLPRPPRGPFSGKPPSFLLRLGVMFLISGAGCFWLAQYVTAPIIRLSEAVRQFAAGNLTVRVHPEMDNRKDEISELAGDFDRMADRIESLLTSQKILLRDISHELRSPLARLNVALELCRQRSDPEMKKSLDRIERESERLNQLIGQILMLNRYESGMPLRDPVSLDLAALIRDIIEDADFEARGSNRGVRLVSCDKSTVSGSQELLRRAVENVVRNAVRYTAEGSEVEISLRSVPNKDTPYAIITVRDHGPGVPEDEIKHLFTPFYRVGEARDRISGGVGLGLAITETSIRLHGGKVKAMNAPGGGFMVEMAIPSS